MVATIQRGKRGVSEVSYQIDCSGLGLDDIPPCWGVINRPHFVGKVGTTCAVKAAASAGGGEADNCASSRWVGRPYLPGWYITHRGKQMDVESLKMRHDPPTI